MYYCWCLQGGCYYIYAFDYSLLAPRHLHTIKKSLIKYGSAIYEQRLPEPSSDSILDMEDSKHCWFFVSPGQWRSVQNLQIITGKSLEEGKHAHLTVPQEIITLNSVFFKVVCCFFVGLFSCFYLFVCLFVLTGDLNWIWDSKVTEFQSVFQFNVHAILNCSYT